MWLNPARWEPTAMCQGLSTTTSALTVMLGTTVPPWLVGPPQGSVGEDTTAQGLLKMPNNTSLIRVYYFTFCGSF